MSEQMGARKIGWCVLCICESTILLPHIHESFLPKNSKLDKSVFRCQGQNKIIKKLKTERKATKLVEIRNQVENALKDVHDCGSTR